MKYETIKLEELCTIKTGTPVSRAKAAASEGNSSTKRLSAAQETVWAVLAWGLTRRMSAMMFS